MWPKAEFEMKFIWIFRHEPKCKNAGQNIIFQAV